MPNTAAAIMPPNTGLPTARRRLYTPGFGASLAMALASAGKVKEAVRVIDDMVAEVEATEGCFILPELLRVWGEICVATDDMSQAQSLFRRALKLAEEQAALSWQLRIATSQARHARTRDQRGPARKQLADIYGRFTEGFATADLEAAKELLASRAADS